MSKFIEGSKHGPMTAAVTTHFFGSGDSTTPGKASGKSFERGGDSAWNASGQDFHQGSGVNYIPRSEAGHTVTTAPFQGSADGLPGSAKMLWDK